MGLLLLLGLVWMGNLYNFMDGIDGITGTETAVIAEVAAAEAAHHVTREEASSPWPTEPSAPVKSSSSAGPERGPDKLAA